PGEDVEPASTMERATAPTAERASVVVQPPPVPPFEPVAPPAVPESVVSPGLATHPEPVEAPPAPPTPIQRVPPSLDLEHRIGARWSTWVGVVAILFGIGFFLKWSFDNDLLGPGTRVVLGLAVGLVLLASGVSLRGRRDVPYLSEGLAGLGLGVLYL